MVVNRLVELVGLHLAVPATIGTVVGFSVAQKIIIYNIGSQNIQLKQK
ncbi:hypothetical protein PRVXT_001901 [Proteinivorax tanatarense]|uniref:Uncharacterized protein n=1 Tax=Proteinivorax tanatarense TaxID=1260629 RepID=A0AAU7VID6_9FIRM